MNKTTCSFEDCGRPVLAKTWCKAHYYQNYHNGVLKPLRVKSGPVECSSPDCTRQAQTKGLCKAHYQRAQAGNTSDAPVRPRTDPRVRDGNGHKRCTTCGAWKPVDQYTRAARSSDGLHGACTPCKNLRQNLLRYNLPEDRWFDMIASQDGKCGICNMQMDSPQIDHDHSCCAGNAKSCGNCVRGLLCIGCNTAIGLMQDDADRLRSAAAYLERSRVG